MNNKNTWTLGVEHHTPRSVVGETSRGTAEHRELGRDNIGRNARYR